MTLNGTFLYEYDAWNRLTKVKPQHDNLTLATYTCDALGRRIKKVVSNSEPFETHPGLVYDNPPTESPSVQPLESCMPHLRLPNA